VASAGRALRGADWAPYLRECLQRSPADLSSWMEQHTQLLKSDTYSRVGLLSVRQQTCFLKLYIAKSPLQNLGFRLGYSRGIKSFDAAVRLALAGIPAPTPRSCLLVPGGILLLTEGIEESLDLRALWQSRPGKEAAGQCMINAGQTIAALHRAGFAHGDCKWSNLLWSGEMFLLVDLEAVRKVTAAGIEAFSPHPRQLQDLARFTADAEALSAGADQYETFLDSYQASVKCSRELLVADIRPLIEVIRERHLQKHGNKHQPLL
jgi:tRNA A-37 threonylcarbamoyl transferase component Bud32